MNPSNFSALAVDSHLEWALGNDGSIYKYDTSANGFVRFYTPSPILNSSAMMNTSGTHIKTYQNRLLLNGTSYNSA